MDVISWGFFFTGVNGASFVRRSGDIWVTGCRYVETVTFVWNSGEPKGELRGVQFPPPPENSEVLTKLNRTAN